MSRFCDSSLVILYFIVCILVFVSDAEVMIFFQLLLFHDGLVHFHYVLFLVKNAVYFGFIVDGLKLVIQILAVAHPLPFVDANLVQPENLGLLFTTPCFHGAFEALKR